MRRSPNRNCAGAFTLVELMVSATILALIVVLLVGVTGAVSTAWQRGESQTRQRTSGRAIMDFIENDLRAALLPVVWADDKIANLEFVLNPTISGAEPEEYRNPDALFWQVPLATNQALGDVAEVGYFVKWDKSEPDRPRPLLCRFFVNPTDGDDFQIYKSRKAWLTGEILQRVAPANNAENPTAAGETNAWRGLLAENVAGFWARWKDAKTQTPIVEWTSRDPNLVSPDASIRAKAESKKPTHIDISLLTLDERGLARMTAKTQETLASGVNESGNATDCLALLRKAAVDDAALSAVLMGARSFETTIRLENFR